MALRNKIICFIISCMTMSGFAQNLYNNGATISIEEGTTFSVGQNAYNNGIIINNGNFLISGAWINNGTYNPGVGEFTLNSANEQIVNHNAQSFQRLVISGGGPKIFQANLSIDDQLELVNGILFSTNEARLIVKQNAQIVGGSQDSYIAGTLFLPNSDQMIYPIGTATTYLPVELSNVQGDAALIGFSLLEPNPITTSENNDIQVVDDYAWMRHDSIGTVNNAIVTFPLLNQTALGSIENVVVLEAPDLNSSFTNAGAANITGDLEQGRISSETAVTGKILSLGTVNAINERGGLKVINAVTPAADNKHDFLRIENIEFYPNNVVKIYNRWGDLVWETEGYNNQERAFTGISNTGNVGELADGTYYYVIEYDAEHRSGFFILRR